MAVYVDTMREPVGRMLMCHMLADTEVELLAMADKIEVARRWHQYPGTVKSHFDITISKRTLAVQLGAVEISQREVGIMIRRRRELAAAQVASNA